LVTGVQTCALPISDDVWAVGYYKPTSSSPEQTLTMHWDGVQWARVTSPNVGSSRNKLWSVSASAPNDVWAVGYYGPQGTGQTLTLHWDGSQWSVINSPSPTNSSYLFDVKAISPGNAWAVGNTTNPAGSVQTLALQWNGVQWRVATSSNTQIGTNLLYGVDAVSDGEVWAVGNYQTGTATLTLTERFGPPAFTDVPPSE